MLAGNVAALLSPIIFIPILTYLFGPQNYDYESMRNIRKVDDSDVAAAAHVDLEFIPGEMSRSQTDAQEEERKLNKAAFYSRILTVAMALCLLVIWPMPMYGSSYVFSKPFFTGWVVVGIIWLFLTAMGVIVYPLWEGRESIVHTIHLMFLDVIGRKKPALYGREGKVKEETPTGEATPTEITDKY